MPFFRKATGLVKESLSLVTSPALGCPGVDDPKIHAAQEVTLLASVMQQTAGTLA